MARYSRNTLITVWFVTGFMILGASVGGVAEALDSRTSFAKMKADNGRRVVSDNTAGREATKAPCGPTARLSDLEATETGTPAVTTRATTTRKQRFFHFIGARKRILNRR